MFGMKNMGDMMKLFGQREKIVANMEAAKQTARTRTTVGEAGAGMVKVTANGMGEVVKIDYDAEALKDPSMLGVLTVSATNVAIAKSREIMAEEISKAMGGIELPPGLFT